LRRPDTVTPRAVELKWDNFPLPRRPLRPVSHPAGLYAVPPFDRPTFDSAPRTLLRDGRWANARVQRAEIGGRLWVVKDFAPRNWWVRNSIGRLFVRRELATLRRLEGLDGVPPEAFRLDAHAIAFGYIEGETLGRVEPERQTAGYFIALEALLHAIHGRGVVHLDTRGTGNVLMRHDGTPALIDFQSALSTRWMPGSMRRFVEQIDLTGVYKKWLQRDPASMGPERIALNERMLRWRRFWVLRGYAGAAKTRPTKAHPTDAP
jgi:RIO1 family